MRAEILLQVRRIGCFTLQIIKKECTLWMNVSTSKPETSSCWNLDAQFRIPRLKLTSTSRNPLSTWRPIQEWNAIMPIYEWGPWKESISIFNCGACILGLQATWQERAYENWAECDIYYLTRVVCLPSVTSLPSRDNACPHVRDGPVFDLSGSNRKFEQNKDVVQLRFWVLQNQVEVF